MKACFLAGTALAAALLTTPAFAEPAKFADVFQDHAVVQRHMETRVWGTARPGDTLTVRLGAVKASTKAGADGSWRLTLPPQAEGGPFDLSVSNAAEETTTLKDVAIGDVFLCAGQSNMAFPLSASINGKAEGAKPVDPTIRLLNIEKTGAIRPASGLPVTARWTYSGPDTAPGFSAVCLLTARELRQDTPVTIGLISAAVGGSPIEDWMSRDALKATRIGLSNVALHDAYAASVDEGRKEFGDRTEAWWAGRKTAEEPTWREAGYDDSGWQKLTLTKRWQEADQVELKGFNGTIWLRQHITLTAAQAASAGQLRLGILNDLDATFVNGVRVGAEDGDAERVYPVAKGLLRAGDNVIAIRLNGTYGNGGVKGPPNSRALLIGNDSLPLSDQWLYRIAAPATLSGTPPRAPWAAGRGYTNLYNGMIAPLLPYGLKGVMWYQGEQNASAYNDYRLLLPALLADWRRSFKSDLPFYIVQLPNWRSRTDVPAESNWAGLREAQRATVKADKKAYLATTIDLGDVNDVHPVNKRDVASRMGLLIRKYSYGKDLIANAPDIEGVTREGDDLVLQFDAYGSRLVTYSADQAIGFELCDSQKTCRYVAGRVAADTVRLSVPAGLTPTLLRYAWADTPVVNLYSANGLPVTPFQWDLKSSPAK
ncbi:sialate O-acetylesterase [Asticcacaulis sp. DXS10W]|uniref:Sialate O-acetylesterase n=1 Tax=Asticcacaulis currens TaxID=2984210 RepID=A0ABT5IBX7_9CAUL|nr:sialate O-acetylesterase [Asticcacaulis currens]MDC7693695.1 sialate O-acetylesterase [Asticcacaulis currens]